MTEHYVSYEQAVTLKRLGFAEKVNHGYSRKIRIEPELSYGDVKEVRSKDPKNYNDNRKGADKGLFFYSAPRLDQAAAWLRDKGVLVWATPDKQPIDDEYSDIELTGEWWWEVDGKVREDSGDTYISYESALSAGLDAALELLGKEVKE